MQQHQQQQQQSLTPVQSGVAAHGAKKPSFKVGCVAIKSGSLPVQTQKHLRS